MFFYIFYILNKMFGQTIFSIEENYFICLETKHHYNITRVFIENYSVLLYNRVQKIINYIDYQYFTNNNSERLQQKKMQWTICIQKLECKNLYQLLLNILNDNILGDVYNCFSNEIMHFLQSYFETRSNIRDKDKKLCDYNPEDLKHDLSIFYHNELNDLYNILFAQTEFNAYKFVTVIQNNYLIQKENSKTKFYKQILEKITCKNIQESYMNFMLPFSDPNNSLQVGKNVLDSFKLLINSNLDTINLFIDFHAEQFLFTYLDEVSKTNGEFKILDAKIFLLSILTDIKMILSLSMKMNNFKTFSKSKVNLYCFRMDEKLSFSLFTFAMSQFLAEKGDLINEICSILDAIEILIPKYLFNILNGFRTESVYFQIEVVVENYQNFSIRNNDVKINTSDTFSVIFSIEDYTNEQNDVFIQLEKNKDIITNIEPVIIIPLVDKDVNNEFTTDKENDDL